MGHGSSSCNCRFSLQHSGLCRWTSGNAKTRILECFSNETCLQQHAATCRSAQHSTAAGSCSISGTAAKVVGRWKLHDDDVHQDAAGHSHSWSVCLHSCRHLLPRLRVPPGLPDSPPAAHHLQHRLPPAAPPPPPPHHRPLAPLLGSNSSNSSSSSSSSSGCMAAAGKSP